MSKSKIVKTGVNPNYYVDEAGQMVRPPANWQLLKPGDAHLTRKVKELGETWTIQEKRGRKVFSKGILAAPEQIEQARQLVEQHRAAPSYEKNLATQRRKRAAEEVAFKAQFYQEVLDFLNFAPIYQDYAESLADAVTALATPVGSGTVARTARLTTDEKAERAVIAWLRHQTTDYDHRVIKREKGARRQVRRDLAAESRELLNRYRNGLPQKSDCPLKQSLENNS